MLIIIFIVIVIAIVIIPLKRKRLQTRSKILNHQTLSKYGIHLAPCPGINSPQDVERINSVRFCAGQSQSLFTIWPVVNIKKCIT